MGSFWSYSADKRTSLRSLNWTYLFSASAWYPAKSLLIANRIVEPLSSPPADYPLPTAPPADPMASVVTQESSDLRLTLPVERASTSPFPSPGSPFYPPPRLGAHEFALRPSSSRSPNPARERDDPAPRDSLKEPAMPVADGATTPTPSTPANPSLSVITTAASPTTPTPGSVFQVKTPTAQITVPDPPPNSETSVSLSAAAAALTAAASNRDSLTSSRPAPPSPATIKGVLPPLPTPPRAGGVKFVQCHSHPFHSPRPKTLLFKIRDYGFPPTDERHLGKGPDVPRPNRPRRRWSTLSDASTSSAGTSQADDDGDGDVSGWGQFPWNTLNTAQMGGQRLPGEGPSRAELLRNFGGAGEAAEDDEDDDEDEYDDAQTGDDEPLVPGLYRALYAFDPEGTAEMALEEEQIVHVVGRGGGVGWAVVEKDGGGHALVPESYLELVEAD
ncbi:uncharacterized protein BXZ73DRAFT_100238 [Epithele typhae]|uniref:uncharacterized protein n=1 Tax=Epithele typhae TaxID=378194 RepID=UPI002007858A|nr:uncharacterized protein BXZ73DRAFT_100238 [Epithele typhae]KAH9936817.1 hypothetical protein BXZ73DRAFT_100238 [Epithele typhae]